MVRRGGRLGRGEEGAKGCILGVSFSNKKVRLRRGEEASAATLIKVQKWPRFRKPCVS